MSGGTQQEKQARVIGHTARMKGPVEVEEWRPPTEAEVDAMPAPASRRVRGWKRVTPQEEQPGRKSRRQPAENEAEMEQAATPTETKSPSGPRERVRPEGLEEGGVQALVWERPEDAAKLVRTMLMEENGAEGEANLLQKVAILSVALEEEIFGELLKHLSDYEIEEITQAIAGLKAASAETTNRVLDEFKQHLMAGEWISVGGIDYARASLERAVGPRKAQEIIERVTTRVSSGFYMLKNVAPDQIAPFISHEHPQTIALILSQLDPAQASGILAQLPQRMQADVSYRIATMENITPNVIKQIEESLDASLRDILGGNQDVGGPKVMADILNLTGSSVEKNVLDQMDVQDPEVAESVRNQMFVFEDIAKLTDREIQVLLAEADRRDLTVALKAATEKLRDKVLGNLSKEERQALTEEMEFLGPMRLSEVEEVQLRIVQQVRLLEEQGKVIIVRGSSDDQFV